VTGAGEWSREQLDYQFRDETLLEQALTHRSAASRHNERLEFLGDAVLGMVIAAILYASKPRAREGALSRFRSRLVRRETLAAVARDAGFGDQVVMGAGERRSGGHQRRSVLANALEAVIGAIMLDGGYEEADRVIRRLFMERIASLPPHEELKDPKTRLQEWLQARGIAPPEYVVTDVSGAAHARSFRVDCSIGELELKGAGSGTSRRRAEQDAAAAILAGLPADD